MEEIMAAFPTINSLLPPPFSIPTHKFSQPTRPTSFLSSYGRTTPSYHPHSGSRAETVLWFLTMIAADSRYKISCNSRFALSLLVVSMSREEWMEVELVKCECCGLKEDCTQDYISEVKAKFGGKWLCGLCSEAVSDEVNRGKKPYCLEDAVKAHMSFCRKFKANPAFRVADGMRQMLRRRSGETSSSPSPSKKYTRSASTSQVANESSYPLY